MAVKEFKVEVVDEPMLRLWYTYFDPISFRVVEYEKMVQPAGLRLTEPERGRQGGFRFAQLVDKAGKVQLEFGKSEQKFYDAVKAALSTKKARRTGSGRATANPGDEA
jgi:hypothetical protein